MSSYFPSGVPFPPLRPNDPLRAWATGSVYSLAFFAPFSIALGQIALAVMLLAGIVFLHRNWTTLKSSPLVWLTGAYIVYVLARGVVAALVEAPGMEPSQWPDAMDTPNLAAAHWEETFRWFRSGPVVIFLVAASLAASGNWQRHSLGALAALLLGFAIHLTQGFDAERLWQALLGASRYHEGIDLFIDALKLTTIIIGLLAFAPLFLRSGGRPGRLTLRVGTWLALLGLASAMVLAMQTRSVWVAGLTGLMALGLVAVWSNRGSWLASHSRRVVASVLGVLLLATALTPVLWGPITDRWSQGGSGTTLSRALSTPPTKWGEALRANSVGIRAAYVSVALDLYRDRPFVGYGPADPRYLRQDYPHLPQKLEGRRGHFHNTHLEFLLSFGALGYTLLALSFLAALGEARHQIRAEGRARMLGLFVVAVAVSLFVFGFATVNFERFKMAHFYGLILGTLWAAHLVRRLPAERQASGAGQATQAPFPHTPVHTT